VERYVIVGGRAGYDRLKILARALAPGTEALLDRLPLRTGMRCLDLGCGSGGVTFALAERVGPSGAVVGIDMDEVKLGLTREEAARRGLANVELRAADVTAWRDPVAYDLVYARMLLQHLARPVDLLRRMWEALRPGGILAVEDADFSGAFCEPPLEAFDFYLEAYGKTVRRRGGDDRAGRKLYRYVIEAGAPAPNVSVHQRVDATGDGKALPHLTLAATADAIVAEGMATPDEIALALADLVRAGDDPGVIMASPRTVQAWVQRPDGSR
jgi:ubiquinone/menaquinone biosynthesis C-methylase UbiE